MEIITAQREDREEEFIRRLYKHHKEFFDIDFKEIRKMKKIGEGGFGCVYEAKYNGEIVAVKRLFLEAHNSYKYLVREVSNLRVLNHDNIIRHIGVCHENFKSIFLVTEYVNGESLNKCYKKIRGSYGLIYHILLNIARGMTYLESINMLHRDLKLANVILSTDLKEVKLCDFGLSKLIEEVSENQKGLKMSCVGTRKYMAPELRNHLITGPVVDSSIDVYSFGVLVAELLGFPVRKGSFTFEKFEKKRDKQAPEELVSLVFICTKMTPEVRPKFRDILHGLQSLEPTLSCPIVSVEQVKKYKKENALTGATLADAARKALHRPNRMLKRSISAGNLSQSFKQLPIV